MIRSLRLPAVAVLTVALSTVAGAPAFAEDGPGHARPCRLAAAGERYVATSDYGPDHKRVGVGQGDWNGSNSNMTAEFTSNQSGTVSVTWQGETSVNGNLVVIGAEAKTHLDLSYSLTATTGNNVTVTVPPHRHVRANWGVFSRKTGGTYHKVDGCHERDIPLTAWTPHFVGWKTWIEA